MQDPVLADALLRSCAERSAGYDRDNRFFDGGFRRPEGGGLLDHGRSRRELGGGGLTLAQMLPGAAAARLLRACDRARHQHARLLGRSCRRSLAPGGQVAGVAAARKRWTGEVFNAGHSERGNDLPVLLSTSKAERVDGGFRITGHKMFGSLSPVFTRYGLHAMWADAEGGPKIVHAFMPRDTPGYRIVETWDTMGMRATRSDDVVLDGVFVPDRYIARILPAGTRRRFRARHLRLGAARIRQCLPWAWPNARSIWRSPGIKGKTSLAVSRSMAYHPEVQHMVADMMLAFDPIGAAPGAGGGRLVERRRPRRHVAFEDRLGETPCRRRRHGRSSDMAMELSGGSGMFRGERDGAAVPRRPLRPVPPGEYVPDPRDRRQDGAGDRSRRTAAMGLGPEPTLATGGLRL